MRGVAILQHVVALQGPSRPARIQSTLFHQKTGLQQCRRFAYSGSNRKSSLSLRPYQEESIESVLDYFRRGERRLGLSLATGSGKTVIFSHLIERVPPPNHGATRTLILAHRVELVDQAARHCMLLYPNKKVDVEMGDKHGRSDADITVASVVTLRQDHRLQKYDPSTFKLVIVDECHHMVSPTYLRVLRHFGLVERDSRSDTALVGVSATMSRNDGLSLGKVLDHIVYHKDYVDMIKDNYLSDMIFTTVRSGVDLSGVSQARGDFQTGPLSRAVNTEETNTIAVRAWLEKARGRKSTLVFCVDLSHVTALTAKFRQHNIDAQFVTGTTKQEIRKERLQSFRRGEFPVLLNCGIFTEGTDIPNIDCVLLARPTRSRNLLVQMVGRGLRKHATKENCHVIDLVGSLDTGIVTTPTLFGLDPDAILDKADQKQMNQLQMREQRETGMEECTGQASSVVGLSGDIEFTDYSDVNELLQDTLGERRIRAISQYAWVQVDDSRYVLSTESGELSIVRKDDAFKIIVKRKLPKQTSKSPYMKPRPVGQANQFEQAVSAADTFVRANFPHRLVQKNASWRRYPASQAQIDFLNTFRAEEDKLEAGSLTKGQAADWVTKIKHGARGRFREMGREKRRAERVREKREEFARSQEAAIVKVGPLIDRAIY